MSDKKANDNEIHDLRRDPNSTAESHVERSAEGTLIVDSRPPQSVAEHQQALKGYDPVKFFDEENAAKRVEGVNAPAPDIVSSREHDQRVNADLEADYAEQTAFDEAKQRKALEQDNQRGQELGITGDD